MLTSNSHGRIERATWFRNRATQSGGGLYCRDGVFSIEHATFSDNRAVRGASLAMIPTRRTEVVLRSSIVAFSEGGPAIDCGGGRIAAYSCDLWQNAGGDWSACFGDPARDRGNFSADPLFCDREAADLTLRADSPCVERAGLDPDPVGAWPVGCAAGAHEVASSSPGATDPGSPAVAEDGTPDSERRSGRGLDAIACSLSPNPFRTDTTVRFLVPSPGPESGGPESAGPVHLAIVDLAGRSVRTLLDRMMPPGEHSQVWDGRDDDGREVPTGIYFARLGLPGRVETARVVRMR
jgi:hypothetical protein